MSRISKGQKDDPAAEILTNGDFNNFITFAEEYLKIQTKGGKLQPFKLNRSQVMRETLITEIEEAGLPVRIWEAKARQLGCSTHVQGRMFWKCLTNFDEVALVAAHADPSVRQVFTKSKMFYDFLPDHMRPMTRYNNLYELDFRATKGSGGLRSRFSVTTARAVDDTRGFTARQVHASEVAFFNNPEAFFLALLQAVPDEPGTMIYSESTCRGSGDFHHSQYLNANVWWEDIPPWMPLKRAYPGHPDSTWYALFTPWFLMEEYARPLHVPRDEFEKSFDHEERVLVEQFADYITFENLQWRRETLVSKCGGSLDRFRQEYPSTDREAYSATGSPAFDRGHVKTLTDSHGCWCAICAPKGMSRSETSDAPKHEWFDVVDGAMSERGRHRLFSSFVPELLPTTPGKGAMSIWRHPEQGKRYVIGCDISNGSHGGDWDVASVFELSNMEQVAEWRGKADLDIFTEIMLMIALLYNNAALAPEVNSMGGGVIAMLRQTQYWNLYRRRITDSLRGPTVQLGWSTNKRTKPEMIGLTQKAIKDGYIKVRSQVALQEMLAYRMDISKDAAGGDTSVKMNAPPGKHDDALMATMIANAVAHHTPGHGSALPKSSRPQVSSDHNQWSAETWELYEKKTESPMVRRLRAAMRRR
jgi:hypothetical protein